VLSPQIDWWWYSKYPSKPNVQIVEYLKRYFPGFGAMNEEEKMVLYQRMTLFDMSKKFISKVEEDIPDDFKFMVLLNGLRVGYRLKDSLFRNIENVVIYGHAFPTPKFPDRLHCSEYENEDEVLIFSMPHFIKGFQNPGQFFPIGIYEFVKAALYRYQELQIPDFNQERIAEVFGYGLSDIEKYMNLPQKDLNFNAILVTSFFVFPEKFKLVYPNLNAVLIQYFGDQRL
jgi:Mlc titration factor MtfA (ptsG expression regulator)